MTTESKDFSSIYFPFRWSRIRYQEKELNERELEELNIFFIFFRKKIRRTKRSKFNTNNITKTRNATSKNLYFGDFAYTLNHKFRDRGEIDKTEFEEKKKDL